MLDIVIVTADGGREYLRECLESLQRHPFTLGSMGVQVIDNASADGTGRMLHDEFPWVEYRALDRNSGYAAANNVGLRRSSAPFVLLLNPDTVLAEGALDGVLSAVFERPDVGAAGCRLARLNGTFDHASKRSFPTPFGALAHFTGVGRRSRSRHLAQYRAPGIGEFACGEVDAVCGAFMMVRREAMEQVGLLDEGYWMYGEDVDWCYRFRQAGWRVWYEGSVTVTHVKGALTGDPRRPRENIAFHRAMGRYYRKFHAGRRPSLDTLVYIAIIGKLTVSMTRSGATRMMKTR